MKRLRRTIFFTTLTLVSVLNLCADDGIKITDGKLHSINYAIESLQYWIDKAREGDTRRLAALETDFEKLKARFERLPEGQDDQYSLVKRRLMALQKRIAVKVSGPSQSDSSTNAKGKSPSIEVTKTPRQLAGIQSMLTSLEADVLRYKDNAKQTARIRGDVQTLRQRFVRLPSSTHPAHAETVQRFDRLERSLQPEGGPLQMDAKQASAYLESIRVKYGETNRLPEVRDIMKNRELTAADVDFVISKVRALGEQTKADLPKLRRVVESTGQGDYWLRWLERESSQRLDQNLESIKTTLDKRIRSGLRDAKGRADLDPEKNRYAFTNAAVVQQHDADHQRTLRTIRQAVRLGAELGWSTNWATEQKTLEDLLVTYASKRAAANMLDELPVEVGTKSLHQIARDVLAKKKYGVGEVTHQVVSSKVIPRDRIEHKKVRSGMETIVRQWKQFQVTTVEIEAGKMIVYANDLAKYDRAPNPTPIGEWILMNRFRRGELSPERFEEIQRGLMKPSR